MSTFISFIYNDKDGEKSKEAASPVAPEPPTKSFEEGANWLSRLTLSYMDPLFVLGTKKTVEHEDLGPISEQDKCDALINQFEKNLDEEFKKEKKDRSLWRALWRTVGYWKLVYGVSLFALYRASNLGPILMANALVRHFEGTDPLSTTTQWIFVCLMFVFPSVGSMLAAQSNLVFSHIGLAFRNILITKIYKKALKLSPAARQKTSTGQIVTMFSNDTQQIQRFMFFVNNVCLAPATIAIALFLIYLQVGAACFVGLCLIVVTLPLNSQLFAALNKVRRKKVVVTDKRVKLMNEILNGIRVIKFYAWEESFMEKIKQLRMKELLLLRQLAYIGAVAFSLIVMAIPVFLPVLTFYAYTRMNNGAELDAARAFTTIQYFELIRFDFVFLPLGVQQYSQALVSCQRMMDFFVSDELEDYVDRSPQFIADEETKEVKECAVILQDLNMGWIREQDVISEELTVEDKDKDKDKDKDSAGQKDGSEIEAAKDTKYKELTNTEAKDDDKENENGISMVAMGQVLKVDDVTPAINRSVATLCNITANITKGSLVAVVGPVGCGKSSFLSALLGEMHLQSGKVSLVGSVAYCDQRPWILNQSLLENILFQHPLDEERLDEVLFACNLEDDISILPGGIQTQIGEKGINLSGGQKARVALARAVYADSDVYLLDDPLSAVDAHVGQFLFHECIKTTLADKTRILVTHQVHLLPYCDHILIMKDGEIAASGTYDEIVAQVDLAKLLPEPEVLPEDADALVVKSKGEESKEGALAPHRQQLVSMTSSTTMAMNTMNFKTEKEDSPSTKEVIRNALPPRSLMQQKSFSTKGSGQNADWWKESRRLYKQTSMESSKLRKEDSRSSAITTVEEKNAGDVAFAAYRYYVVSGGIGLASGLFFFMCAAQAFDKYTLFYLADWGKAVVDAEDAGDPLTTDENLNYLNFLALWSACNLICYIIRSLFLANHRLGTSLKLHNGLLAGTMGSPVSFFDVTPVGRILNRFSSDLLVVDEELSQTISQISSQFMAVLGALVAIVVATSGTFAPLMAVLFVIYNRVQRFFRNTNTAIARLESVSRSPIYSDFSQALNGMSSLRAYGVQDQFVTGLQVQVDRNSIANISQQIATQWLSIRLDIIGASISFFICFLAVITDGDFISAGFFALALTCSFQLTTSLKFLVRMIGAGEAQMNAVERVREYKLNLEQEGRPEIEKSEEEIPQDWPQKGQISADCISMRYREGPLVLKDVSFEVDSNMKVGIAGRTGSGKSSLIVALFRITELETGSIKIDDIDLAHVPLKVLRSRIGIIPQEAVIFSFTVRFNLDPMGLYSDIELWTVLESLDLKDHISSLPKKLDEEVAEGGDNFSAGQRQLICIARAILRKPKVLVLDEATASIDNDTDSLVQKIIREEFKDCTVLTIAHRLHTIIDSDHVMILQNGKMEEFGAPAELLKNEDGLFKSLWDKHQSSHGESSGDLTGLGGGNSQDNLNLKAAGGGGGGSATSTCTSTSPSSKDGSLVNDNVVDSDNVNTKDVGLELKD